jgi:light-regulated signal transduction histidine kinase (bacteriophytochrome)
MITSYLELLNDRAREKLGAEEQEFIGYAVDGAGRMQALIQDLLAYARVDTRGRPLEPTDCEQVLETVLENLKVAIGEGHAVIEHERLPTVKGDRVQLAQVFQNLIGNAIKFHGKAAPRVRIGAHQDNGEWIFEVKDNGIGIDPKNFSRIFVLFQRLHTRQEYPGTGMGLAICKKIVERHGGRIWAESTPNAGASFFFTLPVDNNGKKSMR